MEEYENQGIETIVLAFTILNKKVHILLEENTLKGNFKLLSRELKNTEDALEGAKLTLKDKSDLTYETIEQFYTFSDPYRSPLKRLIGIAYLTIVKADNNLSNDSCKWVDLDSLPALAFDHKEILNRGLDVMKSRLLKSNIASCLLKEEFTLPELQRVYEALLNVKFDRRNFRRKFLSLGLIKTTGEKEQTKGHRPGLYYKFLPLEYKEMEIF